MNRYLYTLFLVAMITSATTGHSETPKEEFPKNTYRGAPKGIHNIAVHKMISTSNNQSPAGYWEHLIDGKKYKRKNQQQGQIKWVQIDLGSINSLYALTAWHTQTSSDNVSFDLKIQISDDTAFTQNVRTVFDSVDESSTGHYPSKVIEYQKGRKGLFIDLKKFRGRCVRIYSTNPRDLDLNNYVEFEIFAPAEILKLELPEPFFGGIPLDFFMANLEIPNYKPRPPFYVPLGTKNIAKDKPITSSVKNPVAGKFHFLVNGEKGHEEEHMLVLAEGLQWVQIDLGAVQALYALALWHFHHGDRVFFEVVVQVADDPDFTQNVRDVFNTDHDNSSGLGKGDRENYFESYKGKFVDLRGINARYIRFYSDGNTHDRLNYYVEAEVFGRPIKK